MQSYNTLGKHNIGTYKSNIQKRGKHDEII